jgi:hypothetical protein
MLHAVFDDVSPQDHNALSHQGTLVGHHYCLGQLEVAAAAPGHCAVGSRAATPGKTHCMLVGLEAYWHPSQDGYRYALAGMVLQQESTAQVLSVALNTWQHN